MPLRQLTFWVFYTWHRSSLLGRFDEDDELRSWGLVSFLQVILLGDIYLWVSTLTGWRFPWGIGLPIAIAAAVLVLAANFVLLLRGDRWKSLAAEFDEAPPAARRRRTRVAWAVIAGTLLWTAVTVYAHKNRASLLLRKPEVTVSRAAAAAFERGRTAT